MTDDFTDQVQAHPEIVRLAEERCRELGFAQSCRLETGRLLQVLTAGIVDGRILEIGTGGAYGTAWLASGLRTNGEVRLYTVETDEILADAASGFFAAWTNVTVLSGDWRTALEHGPFQLAFVDASDAKRTGIDMIVEALAPGGIVLLDDLTPIEQWPAEWRGKPDPIRDAWLNHPALTSTEIRVAADHAAILGVKR